MYPFLLNTSCDRSYGQIYTGVSAASETPDARCLSRWRKTRRLLLNGSAINRSEGDPRGEEAAGPRRGRATCREETDDRSSRGQRASFTLKKKGKKRRKTRRKVCDRPRLKRQKASELSSAGRQVGVAGSWWIALTDSKTDRSMAAQSVPLWRRGVPSTEEAVTPLSLEWQATVAGDAPQWAEKACHLFLFFSLSAMSRSIKEQPPEQ